MATEQSRGHPSPAPPRAPLRPPGARPGLTVPFSLSRARPADYHQLLAQSRLFSSIRFIEEGEARRPNGLSGDGAFMKAGSPSGAEKKGTAGRRIRLALFGGALLLTLLSGGDAWGDRNPLPVLEQAEVNEAISKGVHYLRTHMNPKVPGSWSPNNSYTVGYAALPGLTLLECGLPANDPQVQAAANHVRRAMTSKTAQLDRTYE